MIRAGIAHPLCAILIVLLAAPSGFAQAGAAPVAPAAPKVPGTPLTITILEGENAVNSISLLRSVAPVVEIRDSNDFPVEDASVTFTLPATEPGGSFAQGGKTFSTRSDVHGQAIALPIVPSGPGKFQIGVTAIAGDRKGDTVINQTNAVGAYIGSAIPKQAWYKRRLIWAIAGGAVIAVLVVAIVHSRGGSSSGSTVVVTPGVPVFQ
jgi:hypothetical protein